MLILVLYLMSISHSAIEENFLYGASTMMDPRFKKLPFSSAEGLASIEAQLIEEITLSAGESPDAANSTKT